MKIKVKQWRELTYDEHIKLLEIAADQNWMGRLFFPTSAKNAAE